MRRHKPVTILDANGRPVRRRIKGKWDAAQTTSDNRRHWANADALSASAAASPAVRQTLRNRARYEIANNCYAIGIVNTLTNYCVNIGPRLQCRLPDKKANRQVEAAFSAWAEAVDLPRKLRLLRFARAGDGEGLALLVTNPRVDHEVKLDVYPVEADRCSDPTGIVGLDAKNADGVMVDKFGNPHTYRILDEHPGSALFAASFNTGYQDYPAASVLHTFRQDRAGQIRGVPEITPALPLFSQLRRFTLAVIAAAEAVANLSGVIYSDGAVDEEGAMESDPFEEIELERNMWTTLPYGWKMGQIKAEHPSTTYEMFKGEILNEIARCLNMPYNIAACNSADYNYASGRLDHQTFYVSLDVDRKDFDINILNRILAAWLSEAVLIEGLLPQSLRSINSKLPHLWMWPGFPHADPLKEAIALAKRLEVGGDTLAHWYGSQGRDWEEEQTQRLLELKGMPLANKTDKAAARAMRALITKLGSPQRAMSAIMEYANAA